ncbi:Maf family protein [Desulfallas thermosapovorans]|uniref:dTTP/UTP pyrophosphatase n=1 Tax=Desulfallas thermosapovorans DSM 6562 TaxID=1121431 RepID=A0A5S4ZYQ1_9FIRM|nr:Maf family protein [Desulfallas thermosapovorans]TYO98038.1 septum formation protein [Desulfallas thermosapovorans DSM 6562]
MPTIYLASSSPRRRELLDQIGLPHVVFTVDIDETLPPGLPPAEQVMSLSRSKAEAAAATLAEGIVLAADTVVVLGGEVLGKPENESAARVMLERLQGNTHEVYTGITLMELAGGRVLSGYERTEVRLREMSRAEIEHYVATKEPLDKAGAYGVQGRAAVFVAGIRGCYFNVVGLPLFKLAQMLKELNIEVSQCWR